MMSAQEIASPCIGVCQLHEQRVCIGCWRSIDEIVAWRALNNEEKQQVIIAAEQRQAAARNQIGG